MAEYPWKEASNRDYPDYIMDLTRARAAARESGQVFRIAEFDQEFAEVQNLIIKGREMDEEPLENPFEQAASKPVRSSSPTRSGGSF